MDENPYASPQAEFGATCPSTDGQLWRIRCPAIALIGIATLGLVVDALLIFVTFIDTVRLVDHRGFVNVWEIALANLGASILIVFLHVVVLLGGFMMFRLRTHSMATTAAVISILPLFLTLNVIGNSIWYVGVDRLDAA